MGVFGGIFGAGGLPPVEKPGATAELPIERRFGEEVPDEPEVVVEIHPTNPPGLSRFEEGQSSPGTVSLAAQAPWAHTGISVGTPWFLKTPPNRTSEGFSNSVVAERLETPEQPADLVRIEVPPKRVRAERFKPGEEIHALDIERAELRSVIGEYEGALAALEDEISQTPMPRRQVLVLRTLGHKRDAERMLAWTQAELARKEKRRNYLLRVRDGLRQLSADQAAMGETDFDDWGDEPTTAQVG